MPPRLFCLFQHGSHAALSDFDVLAASITRRLGAAATANVTFFGSRLSEGLGTDAGTQVCADRLLSELVPALTKFIGEEPQPQQQNLFAAVGHSFGGIILRSALHQLWSKHNAQVARHLTPLLFLTLATPHCGVLSMSPVLVHGGRFLGKVYSSTYQELLLDSDLLMKLAASREEMKQYQPQPQQQQTEQQQDTAAARTPTPAEVLAGFRRRCLIGCASHDYLVRVETATLLSEAVIVNEKKPHPLALVTDDSGSKQWRSTHVGEMIHLPQLVDNSKEDAGAASAAAAAAAAVSPPFQQLDAEKGAKIALSLRRQMSFDVIPIFVSQWFCIAHDAIMRKGLNSGALPDVIDKVSELIVKEFQSVQ